VETRLVRNVGFCQCDGSVCLRAARDTRLPPNIIALLPDPRLAAGFISAAAMAAAVEQRTCEWDFSPELEIRSAAHEARLSLSWSAEGWTVTTAETVAR
jgi:hypothetical protein